MKHAVASAMCLVWLTACPGPSDDDGPEQTQVCSAAPGVATGEAKVLVGAGVATFTPLANGAELRLEHGPQGGTHVYLEVLFEAATAGTRTLFATFTPTSGSEQTQQSIVRACAGWNRVQNLRFVLYANGPGKLKIGIGAPGATTPDSETAELDVTVR